MPPAPDSRISVFVVDDHPLFRRGLVDALEEQHDLRVIGQAATAAEAARAIPAEHPDVAIVDLSLGAESGLDLVSTLTRPGNEVRVLVVSAHDEVVHAARAFRAGALGYIMKDKPVADLIAAVRRVAKGRPYVSEDAADRLLSGMSSSGRAAQGSALDRLSDRERQVLTLMGHGRSTREIAEQLTLSIKTVESHYAHIKDKLGIRSGRELMRVAVTWVEHDTV